MKDLTLIVCNYNTPELVVNLLRSVKEVCSELPQLVIMNTSTEPESEEIFAEHGIPYFNYRGGIHGEAVNLAFKKVKTKYALLLDSDVILLQDVVKPFQKFKDNKLTLMGKIVGDCGGKSLYERVEPWYCFMDVETLNNRKIQFFDRVRSADSKEGKYPKVYDIGSTMYQDVEAHGLKIGDVDIENKYFIHYGGMSWRTQKFNPDQGDTDIDFGGTHPHRVLYDIGMRVKDKYIEDTKQFERIDIKGVFG